MAKLNKLGVKNSLWNNIRAKRGSGKKPTAEMLKQEAKIKREDKMNKNKKMYGGKKSMYKKAGFLEESKEITFGNMPAPAKYMDGGKKERLTKKADRIMGRAQKNWSKAQKALDYDEQSGTTTSNAIGYASQKLDKSTRQANRAKEIKAKADAMKKGGFPDLNKDGKTTFADVLKGRLKGEGKSTDKKMMGGKMEYKKGGKSMEPGGGGRFAKMVKSLKEKGKSEDSAKAIAASIGRKKYGKSRFQEMAAKGRARKEEGGFDDDMEMENESMSMNMMDKGKKKKKKVNASAAARKRGAAARKNQKRGRTGCYSGECMDVPMM
jgi:hypothetical protein